MVSEKSLYWLAVGVICVAAINSTVPRNQDWIASLTDRSMDVAQRVSDRATRAVGEAGILVGRTAPSSPQIQLAAARVQSRLARVQARIAVQQASMARVQAQQVRMITVSAIQHRVVCPRVEVHVSDPDIEISDDSK
jgi:hypothetical protein